MPIPGAPDDREDGGESRQQDPEPTDPPDVPARAGLDPGAGAPSDQGQQQPDGDGSGGVPIPEPPDPVQPDQPDVPARAGLDPGAGAGTRDPSGPTGQQQRDGGGGAGGGVPIPEPPDPVQPDQPTPPRPQPGEEVFQADRISDRNVVLPEDRRARLVDRVAGRSPAIDREDIVGFRESSEGFRPLLTAEAKAARARETIAEQADVAAGDILGFRATETGPAAVIDRGGAPTAGATLREELAAEDPRLSPSDIQRVERTNGGVQAILTEDARREIAADQLAAENPLIDESDIRRVEPGDDGEFRPVLFEDAQRDLAANQLVAENADIEQSDLLGVEQTDDGEFRPILTSEAREDIAREQFFEDSLFTHDFPSELEALTGFQLESPLASVEHEEFRFDADPGGSVDVSLTDEGLRQATAAQSPFGPSELSVTGPQGDREVQPRDSALPGSEDRGFIEEARATVGPVGRMSLSDPEALDARREKEAEMFDIAEAITTLDLADDQNPFRTAAYSTPALLGAGADLTGRALVDVGQSVERLTTPDVGPSVAGEQVGNVPGHLIGGTLTFSGAGVSAVGMAPFSVSRDIETQLRGGETPTELEGGVLDTAVTFGETQARSFQERPLSTGLGFGLPMLAGVPAGIKGFSATRGTGGRTVQFSEITSPRGEAGGLPEFRTGPSEPTARAVGEVQTRAAEQPPVVQEAAGSESVLFHSAEGSLGRELTVGEGASELPGLFTSPDASPLRLRSLQEASQSRPLIGTGDLSLTPDQLAAIEMPRGQIRGMPESASGAAHAVRRNGRVVETGLSRAEANRIVAERGGQRIPDPTTSGARYLTEQADPGTAQVRPRGSRSPELEAVIPPESQFAAGQRIGVELPSGETVPMEVFRQAQQPARGGEGAAVAAGETATAADIAASSTALSEATPTPVFTPTPSVGAASIFGGIPEFRPSSGRTTTPTGSTIDTAIPGSGLSRSTPSTGQRPDAVFAPLGLTEALPSRPSTSESPAPTSVFTSGFSSAPTSQPPSAPTNRMTTGVDTPPSTPTSPSTSLGFGTGVSDVGIFGAFSFGDAPFQRQRRDRETDRDDPQRDEIDPAGQLFGNPVASGGEFLFGGGALDFGLGTTSGTNQQASPETEAVFGGDRVGMGDAELFDDAEAVFGFGFGGGQ